MPVPSGVLSDESVKKSCAAFFPSNPLVAEDLDPVPPYDANSFFTGIKQPPPVSRVRPKRAYDDISTFLSMSGNVEMIPKAIDDYNEAAKQLYEKKGTGFATTSSVQQPLKEDDDYDFGERPSMTLMLAGLLGGVGVGAYYLSGRMSAEERSFRRLVQDYDEKYREVDVLGNRMDMKITPMRKAMIAHFEQMHGVPADDRVHRSAVNPGNAPVGSHHTAHDFMRQIFDMEDVPQIQGYHDSYIHVTEQAGEAGLGMGFLYEGDKPNEFPYGMT